MNLFGSDERVVNESDGRYEVYNSPNAQDDIIKCIGQLWMKFPGIGCGTGTGTVYKVDDDTGNAFVITCAHNFWYEGKTPSKIHFRRRSIDQHSFGDLEKVYDCNIETIQIFAGYKDSPSCTSGLDLAIIQFKDDNYYKNICKNVEIVDTENIVKYIQQNNIDVNIWGYPATTTAAEEKTNQCIKAGQMWGMDNKLTDYDFHLHKKTNRNILIQRTIDTYAGQSGSCLWIKDNDIYRIFCIHTGWFDPDKQVGGFGYNTATAFYQDHISFINNGNVIQLENTMSSDRGFDTVPIANEMYQGNETDDDDEEKESGEIQITLKFDNMEEAVDSLQQQLRYKKVQSYGTTGIGVVSIGAAILMLPELIAVVANAAVAAQVGAAVHTANIGMMGLGITAIHNYFNYYQEMENIAKNNKIQFKIKKKEYLKQLKKSKQEKEKIYNYYYQQYLQLIYKNKEHENEKQVNEISKILVEIKESIINTTITINNCK